MADIRHFVVLMLENRSFDSMLGWLDPPRAGYNGLKGDETNSVGATTYRVSNSLPSAGPFTVPTPDPGESYDDIAQQLAFGPPGPRSASMAGFAKNYAAQSKPGAPCDPQAVLHYYTAAQLPIMHKLAAAFGVSDQWFASAPCQTWPNRFFAHTGTCYGVVNNKDFFAAGQEPFRRPSIFRALETAGKAWKVYFHDFPQSLLLADCLDVATAHFRRFPQFLVDAHMGVLPAYSFIEPNYFADLFTGAPPNDQHPPHDVRYGEKLIADVYNAVRASPCWENTLLLITYDEHGGCYDHQAPPRARPPGDGRTAPDGFAFDAFGVRVPALVVSPWIPRGALLQPMASGPYPFDHASIIKTARELCGIGAPLTDRDAAAPSLLPFLTLPAPTNSGPAPTLNANCPAPTRAQMQAMGAEPPNDFVSALAAAAERLASGFPTAGRPPGATPETLAQVGTRARAQVQAFLAKL